MPRYNLSNDELIPDIENLNQILQSLKDEVENIGFLNPEKEYKIKREIIGVLSELIAYTHENDYLEDKARFLEEIEEDEEALEILRELAIKNPDNKKYADLYTDKLNSLSMDAYFKDQSDAAGVYSRQAINHQLAFLKRNPEAVFNNRGLGECLIVSAEMEICIGNLPKATLQLKQALKIFESLDSKAKQTFKDTHPDIELYNDKIEIIRQMAENAGLII